MSVAQAKVDAVVEWLVRGAKGAKTPADVVTRLCADLVDAGVPLDRCEAYVRTLHPAVAGRSFAWTPGHDVVVSELSYRDVHSAEMQASAVASIFQRAALVRRKLRDASEWDLRALANDGFVEWIGAPLEFITGEVHGIAFATKRAGGFDDDDVRAIDRVVAPLSRIAEIFALLRTATNLLNAYVGHDAGARILAGQIHRGETNTIRAVIWFSDLRGFTSMSSSLPPQKIIATLNDVFDCQVPAIEKRDGQVLKFMGDGMLAIFPVDVAAGEVAVGARCDEALAAAREAFASLDALNGKRDERDDAAVSFGVSLHIGDIAYGNIGGANRLDFTCIGPAVNLAARLETLTGKLGRRVVVSEDVAKVASVKLEDLGAFELKGVPGKSRAFGLSSSRRDVLRSKTEAD